jgi:hypothetical protein
LSGLDTARRFVRHYSHEPRDPHNNVNHPIADPVDI